jgi:HEAT repeat protein
MPVSPPLLLIFAMLLLSADPAMHPAADTAQLREMLYDRQQPRNQSQAALSLVESSSRDAEEVVRGGLRQTDSAEVFLALAAAIRLKRDSRFVDELLEALDRGQPSTRQTAALTLAELADAKVVRHLKALLDDAGTESAIRQAVVSALGRSGSRPAAQLLLDQLSSDDGRVREAAAQALGELTGQNYGLDIGRWRTWWETHKELANESWLEERLGYQSSRARRLEGELERAKNEIVRLHQQLYSRLPAGDRLGQVQALSEAEDAAVRALAVNWCLELLPTADAVGQRALADLLLRFSHDGTLEVQRAAVLGLGRIADRRAFERLRALAQHHLPAVRTAAARSLAQQVKRPGPELIARQRQVVSILQKALDDPALEVVIEAAESLGTLGVPEAGPVLTVLLRHPSQSVRQTAALALERVADPGIVDGLIEALDDPLPTVRFSLVGALGHAVGDGRTLS